MHRLGRNGAWGRSVAVEFRPQAKLVDAVVCRTMSQSDWIFDLKTGLRRDLPELQAECLVKTRRSKTGAECSFSGSGIGSFFFVFFPAHP